MRQLVLIICCLLFFCCFREEPVQPKHEEGALFSTWESRQEKYPVLNDFPWKPALFGFFPVAGIASHHLLTGSMIDRFFSDLKNLRPVATFLIISPLHWDLDEQEAVSTFGTWATSPGAVENNIELSRRIIEGLRSRPNDSAFLYEHGVAVFMPFIKRYFPEARVSVLAVPGEPPVNMSRVLQIAGAVLPELEAKDIFLLVSSDFAHHGDTQTSRKKDEISRGFLENPDSNSWIFAGCDNRPGMFVYGSLADAIPGAKSCILSNSNSYSISGEGETDITSYFFTFLGSVSE